MDRNIDDLNNEFIRLNDAGLLTDQAKRKEKGDYHIRNGLTKEPCFKKIDCTKMLPPITLLDLQSKAYGKYGLHY